MTVAADARFRIVLLEPGGWGGIAHYTYNLAQALSRREDGVVVVTAHPYELEHLPRGFTLEACLSPEAGYMRNVSRVVGVIRRYCPHLLHVQGTLSARKDWVSFALARIAGLPCGITAHNLLPHDPEEANAPGMVACHHLLYAFARGVVVHSPSIAGELRRRFGVEKGKVFVIPHGDYSFFRQGEPTGITPGQAREQIGLPAKARVILALGSIRTYKGLPDLIDAVALIRLTRDDVHLVIAGQPHRMDPAGLRLRIEKSGLLDRVVLRTEYIPAEEIHLYYTACDIAAFPYHAIAQSGALQLAYAFSKPVVVTRVGAFPETVKDGWNGRIVAPGSPQELADAIRHLLDLPAGALDQMGRRSAGLAASSHSWETIAADTHRAYAEMIGGAPR